MSHHQHHGIRTSTVVEVGLGLLIGAAISERQQKTGEGYFTAAAGTLGEFAFWMIAIVAVPVALAGYGYVAYALYVVHPLIAIVLLLLSGLLLAWLTAKALRKRLQLRRGHRGSRILITGVVLTIVSLLYINATSISGPSTWNLLVPAFTLPWIAPLWLTMATAPAATAPVSGAELWKCTHCGLEVEDGENGWYHLYNGGPACPDGNGDRFSPSPSQILAATATATTSATAPERSPVVEVAEVTPFASRIPRYPTRDNMAPRY